MISYWKTQWGRLLCALLCFAHGLALSITLSPEYFNDVLVTYDFLVEFNRICLWFLSSCFWLIMSLFSYYDHRTKELDRRLKALEERK